MATTFKELISEIASEGFDEGDVSYILKLAFDSINNTVKSGDNVRINNFGTFKLATRSARGERKGRNPRTGEEVIISAQPEKQVITFKPSKASK